MSAFKKPFKLAFWDFAKAANPALANKISPKNMDVFSITDLGATATPNTLVKLLGNGVNVTGNINLAYDRLHPKNTFATFGNTVKRPTVRFHHNSSAKIAKTVTVADVVQAINTSLGASIEVVGEYKDLDGAASVSLPAVGGSLDLDLKVTNAKSLVFRPDSVNGIPVRIVVEGNYLRGVTEHGTFYPITNALSAIRMNNGGYVADENPKVNLQVTVYNVDFSDVFYSLDLQNDIISNTAGGVITGPLVTAINSKLAALGLGVTTSGLQLESGSVEALYDTAPNVSMGDNTRMARVVRFTQTSFVAAAGFAVTGPVALHLKTTPV